MKTKILTLIAITTLMTSGTYKLYSQGSWQWAKGTHNNLPYNGTFCTTTDKYENAFVSGFFQYNYLIFGKNDTLFGEDDFNTYLAKYDANGNLLWKLTEDQRKKKNLSNCSGVGLNIDDNQNLYWAGIFSDTISFQSFLLTSPLKPGYNTYLLKMDSHTNVKWVRQAFIVDNNPAAECRVQSSTMDKFGFIYLTGYFTDTVVFGTDTIISSPYAVSFFLAKYDTAGNFKWVKQSLNKNIYCNANGYSISVDNNGSVYVAGFYSDTVSFDSQIMIGPGYNDNGFLVKYDTGGIFKWIANASCASSSCSIQPFSVCNDIAGEIYITGEFEDTAFFGKYTLIGDSIYLPEVFYAKYDTGGNIIWAKQSHILEHNHIHIEQSNWFGDDISTDNQKNIYLNAGRLKADGNIPSETKIVFDSDSFYISKGYYSDGWFKFDSTGKILYGYLFPDGCCGQNRTLSVDASGCTLYMSIEPADTILIFNGDTIGNNADINCRDPSVTKWGCNNEDENVPSVLQQLQVTLYPNPNNGEFTIEWVVDGGQWLVNAEIQIYNIYGQGIYSTTIHYPQFTIHLNNEPDGIYFYRLINRQENERISGKFIIQN